MQKHPYGWNIRASLMLWSLCALRYASLEGKAWAGSSRSLARIWPVIRRNNPFELSVFSRCSSGHILQTGIVVPWAQTSYSSWCRDSRCLFDPPSKNDQTLRATPICTQEPTDISKASTVLSDHVEDHQCNYKRRETGSDAGCGLSSTRKKGFSAK